MRKTFGSFESHKKEMYEKLKLMTKEDGTNPHDLIQVWAIISTKFQSLYLYIMFHNTLIKEI